MSIEDAANLFGQELGGTPGAVARRSSEQAPAAAPQRMFADNAMEGDPDAGYGNDEPDEGGDAYEEEQARREPRAREREPRSKEGEAQPRDADTGRFMKNEGPIDDGDEGEDADSKEGGSDEGGEDGEDGEARSGDRIAGVPADTKIKITVDGKEEEVTLKEATEGYIRTKTFHQRLSALDDDRKIVDRDRAAYGAALENTQKGLEGILMELKLAEPAEPDWDKLYRENPTEAARQKVLWDRYQGGKSALLAQHRQVLEARQNEQNESARRYIAAEGDKLLAKFPHWKDSKAREKDQSAIKKTLKDAGFSDQEIGSVFDSRMVTIAMKAARFDRLSSQGMPRRSNRRPMPPGPAASSNRGRSGSNNGNRALRDHAARQTLDSAADAMHAILNQE